MRAFINFNKEILFGEIGALIGAQVFAFFAYLITESSTKISASATIGAVLGAAVFFLSLRFYHKKCEKDFCKTKFATDLFYFTPAAFVLTILVYYPTLFFLDRYLLNMHFYVSAATFIAQLIAFLCFMITINIYRFLLLKLTGRKL
ncbi:MAG: hypothetical protein QXS38_00910 [Candidatus Pacearchaeota archaeon]